MGSYPYDAKYAVRRLKRVDRRLAGLIEQIGPYRLEVRSNLTPFQMLVRAIVYQQLSGHAARAILTRVYALFPRRRALTARQLLALPPEALRQAGLSQSKLAAVLDLAQKTLDGTVPTKKRLATMSDEDIVARLTQICGVGRWSVEMLLIFHLARSDVLPVHDLGVRKGLMYVYRLGELPTPSQLLAAGEKWRPYRSVASWYLWRGVELFK